MKIESRNLTTTASSTAPAKEHKHPASSTAAPAQAAPQRMKGAEGGASFSKVSDYVAVYVIYIFISGWSYGEFYLRALGISPGWFDLSLSEVLVNGFRVLFGGGQWIVPFYLLVLLIPILVEIPSWNHRASIRIFSVIVLVSLLWPIFLISRTAGLKQASIDTTPQTSRLQVITFTTKDGTKYLGRLAYFKTGLYFIRDVNPLDTDNPSPTLELSIYRAEDIQDVRVTTIPMRRNK